MSTFAVALLCIQACLVQNVFGQCLGALGPAGVASGALSPAAYGPAGTLASGPYGYRTGIAEPAYSAAGWAGAYPAAGLSPYGGAGEGNVGVVGELPVAGTTAVTGQIPVMGAVSFGGSIPAVGGVSITGNCACGCGPGIPYLY